MFAPHLEPLRHFSIKLSTQHSIVKAWEIKNVQIRSQNPHSENRMAALK